MGMSGLIIRRDDPLRAVVDHPGNPPHVAEQKVHVISTDDEPTAPIDPGPPCPQGCDQVGPVPIIQFRRDLPHGLHFEAFAFIVIDSDVELGIGPVRSLRPGSSQHHSHDAGKSLQNSRRIIQNLLHLVQRCPSPYAMDA